MPKVFFTQNLQRHVKLPPGRATGFTVGEVLENLLGGNSMAKSYILDEQGSLRKHMNIFVGNRMIQDRVHLSDSVQEDSEIHVIQALSGG